MEIATKAPVPIKVKQLFVRRPDPDEEGGFSEEEIDGQQAILDYLRREN